MLNPDFAASFLSDGRFFRRPFEGPSVSLREMHIPGPVSPEEAED